MDWHANRFRQGVDPHEGDVRQRGDKLFSPLEIAMLGWALTFLIIALIAGVLGFGVVAGTAASIAKILFVVFLVLFVIGLVLGRRGPVA